MSNTRSVGIISNTSGFTGGLVINSLNFSENVQVAECRGEHGEVLDMCAFSKQRTVTIDGVLDSQRGELAEAGNVIQLDGASWLIESVQKTETNNDYVKVNMTCRSADSAIITVLNGAGKE